MSMWGIPLEVRESIVLEVGDQIPDGCGACYTVIGVGDNEVVASHNTTGDQRRFPRELDLSGSRPGYILRPPRPNAYIGKLSYESLKKLSEGLKR